MLEVRLHQLHQTGTVVAVDHAVVPRRREVHDAADDDVAVVHHRSVLGVVNTEDADFGLVDDRGCTQSAKATQARDGEGGPGQVVHAGFAVSGGLRDTAHLSSGLPDVHGFHVLHDGNVQASVGLRGNAEVDGLMTGYNACFVVVDGIAFGTLSECLDQGLHDERQVGQLWGRLQDGSR